jgi:hypothetical protein
MPGPGGCGIFAPQIAHIPVYEPLVFLPGFYARRPAFGHPDRQGSQRSQWQQGPPPVPPLPTAWLICRAFIALTLLVASLTYRYLEVPARSWINPRRESQPAAALPAS